LNTQYLTLTACVTKDEIEAGIEPLGAVTEENAAERIDRVAAANVQNFMQDPAALKERLVDLIAAGEMEPDIAADLLRYVHQEQQQAQDPYHQERLDLQADLDLDDASFDRKYPRTKAHTSLLTSGWPLYLFLIGFLCYIIY